VPAIERGVHGMGLAASGLGALNVMRPAVRTLWNMAKPFFTIGHSSRPIDTFVDLLNGADVKMVVDVRTVSRAPIRNTILTCFPRRFPPSGSY
jgi:hypothetical protein